MKHFIKTVILALATLLPTIVTAHNFEVGGIYYNIDGNEATVTYKGSSYDQYSDRYTGDLTIPATVTYNGNTYTVTDIGIYAFYKCNNLTSVTIPESVTSINSVAFGYCSSLTSVTIPNSVTFIGSFAFEYCNQLTSITIPDSVIEIGWSAFVGCTSLASITIPNSVAIIGSVTFDDTPWYKNQPDGLVYAGMVAYKYKGTMPAGTSITLREGTRGIAGAAFQNCSGLTSITIPNSVINIGPAAFKNCNSLTGMTLPNALNSIGSSTFQDCKVLTSLVLPNTVKTIGNAAFRDCSGLTNVNIPDAVTRIEGNTFHGCSSLTSITIPDSVTFIGAHAFTDCSSLTSLTIPSLVSVIGQYAFSGCSSLTSITVASDNPYFDSRENCNAIINSESNVLCFGCSNSFIPNTVTAIDYGAFWGAGITSISLPNSVTEIYSDAFTECTSISKITVADDNPKYDSRNNCNAIIETASNTLVVGCQNTFIPNTVTVIGERAFRGHSEITSIAIPNSITLIDEYAFFQCNGLSSVAIPNSVTTINADAFRECKKLKRVSLGSSVSYIAERSFYSDSINTVYCYATTPPRAASGSAFATYIYTALHVPSGLTETYRNHSFWCRFVSISNDAKKPTGVSISQENFVAEFGDQINLTATVTPSNATEGIIWQSTNPDVATVDNGQVKVVGYGECDIVATCLGIQAFCHVTVHDKPGDANSDGKIDVDDVTTIINQILSNEVSSFYTANADLNGDGIIDIDDITALVSQILGD